MSIVQKVLIACVLCVFATGCKKGYKCPEQKDTSQLAKWQALGVAADAKGVVVCEASDENFSAAFPSPPTFSQTALDLEGKLKAQGWQATPAKGYRPRTDEHGISRRYEKCTPPQNPLGTTYVDCTGQINLEVDAISESEAKLYLVALDHRPQIHNRHVLSPE